MASLVRCSPFALTPPPNPPQSSVSPGSAERIAPACWQFGAGAPGRPPWLSPRHVWSGSCAWFLRLSALRGARDGAVSASTFGARKTGETMAVGPVRERDVVAGLGWPEKVTPDDHVGWPRVPRETLQWPREASALRPAVTDPADQTPAPPASPIALTAAPPNEVVIRAPGPRRAHFD